MQMASTAVNEFLAQLHPYRYDDNAESAVVRASFISNTVFREAEETACGWNDYAGAVGVASERLPKPFPIAARPDRLVLIAATGAGCRPASIRAHQFDRSRSPPCCAPSPGPDQFLRPSAPKSVLDGRVHRTRGFFPKVLFEMAPRVLLESRAIVCLATSP
jgi:hypothetical protein